jgi:hypothetical protein
MSGVHLGREDISLDVFVFMNKTKALSGVGTMPLPGAKL